MAEHCCSNDFLLPQKGPATPRGREMCAVRPSDLQPSLPWLFPGSRPPPSGMPLGGLVSRWQSNQNPAPQCSRTRWPSSAAWCSWLEPVGPAACLCCQTPLHSQTFSRSRVILSLQEDFIEDGAGQGWEGGHRGKKSAGLPGPHLPPESPRSSSLFVTSSPGCHHALRLFVVGCLVSWVLSVTCPCPPYSTLLSVRTGILADPASCLSTQHHEWHLSNGWVDR